MLLKISPRQAGQQAKALRRWTGAISGWQGVVGRCYIDAGAGTMVYVQVGKCHRRALQNMRSLCHWEVSMRKSSGSRSKLRGQSSNFLLALPLTSLDEFYGSKEKFCLPLGCKEMF